MPDVNAKLNEFLGLWGQYYVFPKNWSDDDVAAGKSPLVHFMQWLDQDWVDLEKMDTVLQGLRQQATSDRNYPSLFVVKDAYAKASGGTGYSEVAEGCSCCEKTGLIHVPVAFKWEGSKRHAFFVTLEKARNQLDLGWHVDVFVYPCRNCGLGRQARSKAFEHVSQDVVNKAFDYRVSPVQFQNAMCGVAEAQTTEVQNVRDDGPCPF